eukprot:NODE_9920_length_1390_cov_7.317498.p1 GENE.NODE_9920_length_1390_cov_7.317498~~NODE_9920_length_1390_cov_7.317498.p1  ORF type:complete len:256 (-),score=63.93 NODE_9920_length_1390_cov_7.317498:526-1293(-)
MSAAAAMPAAAAFTVNHDPLPPDEECGGKLAESLCALVEGGELVDIAVTCGNHSFPACSTVLAAVSPVLHDYITRARAAARLQPPPLPRDASATGLEFSLNDVCPEAVQAMLDSIYGLSDVSRYNPSSEEANRDALRLAHHLQLVRLHERASQWLVQDLTPANLVERLMTCEEFSLVDVRAAILERLVANPTALMALAKDPDITSLPIVLQDLLVRVLELVGVEDARGSRMGHAGFTPEAVLGETQSKLARMAAA